MSESTAKFWAIISKVQTMADGGLRVYLDLPEDAVEEAAVLMQYKRLGVVADVTMMPREKNESIEQDDDVRAVSRVSAKKRIKQGDAGVQ